MAIVVFADLNFTNIKFPLCAGICCLSLSKYAVTKDKHETGRVVFPTLVVSIKRHRRLWWCLSASFILPLQFVFLHSSVWNLLSPCVCIYFLCLFVSEAIHKRRCAVCVCVCVCVIERERELMAFPLWSEAHIREPLPLWWINQVCTVLRRSLILCMSCRSVCVCVWVWCVCVCVWYVCVCVSVCVREASLKAWNRFYHQRVIGVLHWEVLTALRDWLAFALCTNGSFPGQVRLQDLCTKIYETSSADGHKIRHLQGCLILPPTSDLLPERHSKPLRKINQGTVKMGFGLEPLSQWGMWDSHIFSNQITLCSGDCMWNPRGSAAGSGMPERNHHRFWGRKNSPAGTPLCWCYGIFSFIKIYGFSYWGSFRSKSAKTIKLETYSHMQKKNMSHSTNILVYI